jgi:hypothetical protein
MLEPRIVMCGDDEDGWHVTEAAAIQYYAVGSAVGWHFNPKKQLLSRDKHEFLQIMLDGTMTPTQPLAAAVVTYVTGNWYKSPLIDIASLPLALMSNTLELMARGANPPIILDTTRKILNSVFRYQYGRPVRWDQLLPKDFCARYTITTTPSALVTSPSLSETWEPRLTAEVAHTRSEGMIELVNANWDILAHVKPGQRQALITSVGFEIFKAWYTTALNANVIRPELSTGHVRGIALTAERATYEHTLTAGMLLIAPQGSITPAQAAAASGIPLPFYTAVEPAKLAAIGNARLAGMLSAIEPQPTHPELLKYKQGVYGSLSWFA